MESEIKKMPVTRLAGPEIGSGIDIEMRGNCQKYDISRISTTCRYKDECIAKILVHLSMQHGI